MKNKEFISYCMLYTKELTKYCATDPKKKDKKMVLLGYAV